MFFYPDVRCQANSLTSHPCHQGLTGTAHGIAAAACGQEEAVAFLDDHGLTTAGQLTLAVCDEQRNKALLVRCVLKRAVLGIHGEIFTLRQMVAEVMLDRWMLFKWRFSKSYCYNLISFFLRLQTVRCFLLTLRGDRRKWPRKFIKALLHTNPVIQPQHGHSFKNSHRY